METIPMELNKAKSNIFSGVGFHLVLMALTLIGSLFALEIFTIPISMLLVSLALWTSGSIKPFLFFIITIAYHLPREHLYPSDYYTTGYRPYLLLGSIAILFISLGAYVVRNQIFRHAPVTKTPLFIPLCVMTVGMLLNGAMNPDYKIMNLVWAALMMVVYFFLYIVIYLSIRKENPRKMAEYFSFITLLTSWILIAHMAKIYFVDGVIVDGSLDRNKITMGYGVCTLIGFHVTTLIPINFYGFMKGKTPALSLITAVILWIAGIATSSRNAALIGTAYFIFCLIFAAFYGRRVVAGRVILGATLGITALLIMIFGYYYVNPDRITIEPVRFIVDNARVVIEQYIARGLGSSGRTSIWKKCVELFLEDPIFGKGFFGMQVSAQFVPQEYIPEYAHNTIFELLGATGIVGTACYAFYRIATIKMMFHRFDLDRFMMLLGASVLVVESLLDNYVFQIFTTFYYVIAFAIAARLYEIRKGADHRLEPLR